jgi:hypothetical protein
MAGLRWSPAAQRRSEKRRPALFQEVRDAQPGSRARCVDSSGAPGRAGPPARDDQEMAEILGVDIGGSVGRAGGC